MHKHKPILRLMFCLVIGLIILLAGCSPKGTTTVDPNLIYTQAAETVAVERENTRAAEESKVDVDTIKTQSAQTVIADLTQNAPQPTPTETQAPVRPTATSQPTSEGGNGSTPQETSPEPQTKPSATAKVEDVAQFLYQWPPDNYEIKPGTKFDAVFRFKNVGPTTWNSSYTLRWYWNNKFGLEKVKLTLAEAGSLQQVKPGETVEITIKGLQAPSAAGTYQSNWRLCNDKVQCFYLVYIQIVVK